MDIETNVLGKGIVVVRDGTHQIVLYDHLTPEESAMALSLYSRDPQTVLKHLEQIERVGPTKFMGQFYVGYGHVSIGDCGTTNICFENVSLLAAKAIQDWALYNGQEASTRYLDMSAQPLIDPLGTIESKAILDDWMILYRDILEKLIPYLEVNHPLEQGQDEKIWKKAIKARAFDIARGFLPASIGTYVGWHSNLRQTYDHIHILQHHPLPEVRALANNALVALKHKYPSSFSHKTYPDQEAYLAEMAKYTYFDDRITGFSVQNHLKYSVLGRYKDALTRRPKKTELPAVLRNAGNLVFRFLLDFGSYRDLQRHRSVVIPMPLLTTLHGFHPWYIEQLPKEIQNQVSETLDNLSRRINALDASPEILQYYTGIGYRVACEVTANLPAAVYTAELRSGQAVHSTLRQIAQMMGAAIGIHVPSIAIHCDENPDSWSIKRGTHDIVKKE